MMAVGKQFGFAAWCLVVISFALASCGGGGSSSTVPVTPPVVVIPPTVLPNEHPVYVDTGPTSYNVNRLYTDVTICAPGTTQCQTIDHVLVDTGSVGLRLLSSVVSKAFVLPKVEGSNSQALVGCVQFLDNTYAFGPVVRADVLLGGEKASNLPIQVIADPAYNALAAFTSGCSTGTANDSVDSLGAKGILGLGSYTVDCGAACVGSANTGFYLSCATAQCSSLVGSRVPLSNQLQNPIPLFSADNNGLVVDMSAVGPSNAPSARGTLIFGIGTRSNNQPGTGPVITTDFDGRFSTVVEGRTLASSFFDTGSNGYFFDSTRLAACTGPNAPTSFFCPPALTEVTTVNVGLNGVRQTVTFSAESAKNLFTNGVNAVLPRLTGPVGDATIFDWGLPFYYGRRVYMGIEGQTSVLGTGFYYAF